MRILFAAAKAPPQRMTKWGKRRHKCTGRLVIRQITTQNKHTSLGEGNVKGKDHAARCWIDDMAKNLSAVNTNHWWHRRESEGRKDGERGRGREGFTASNWKNAPASQICHNCCQRYVKTVKMKEDFFWRFQPTHLYRFQREWIVRLVTTVVLSVLLSVFGRGPWAFLRVSSGLEESWDDWPMGYVPIFNADARHWWHATQPSSVFLKQQMCF